MKRRADKLPDNQDQLPATQPDNTPDSTAHKGIALSKVVELHRKGLKGHEIAQLLGCSENTVYYHLRKVDPTELTDFIDNDKLHLRLLQKRIVDSISDDGLKGMSEYQKIVGIGIIQDKVSNNTQTVNLLNLSIIVDQLDKRVRGKEPQDIDITPNVKRELPSDES